MQRPTFHPFARQWFNEHRAAWRPSYQQLLISMIKDRLLPVFGHLPIHEITKSHILMFRTDLADEGLANESINRILGPLRQILNEGAARYAFDSPFQTIKSLPIERGEIDPFSPDEVSAILSALPERYRHYYTLLFITGARTAEAIGLQWHYVDLDRDHILIEKTWTQGRISKPKSEAARRIIPINPLLREALYRQKADTGHHPFVFANRVGKPLDKDNLNNRVWAPTLKKLGIRHRRSYQTRHTAASLMLSAGESPLAVAKLLGHRVETLFSTYARFLPNAFGRDGEKFEHLISEQLNKIIHFPERLPNTHSVIRSPSHPIERRLV